MRISVERLRALYLSYARHHGADEDDAGLFADGLLRADLRGHSTQGIGLLPYIEELFELGAIDFGRRFEVVRETPATALVDGHRGVGQVVGTRAMRMAISKACDIGVGLVTVRGASDYAMASTYALQGTRCGSDRYLHEHRWAPRGPVGRS